MLVAASIASLRSSVNFGPHSMLILLHSAGWRSGPEKLPGVAAEDPGGSLSCKGAEPLAGLRRSGYFDKLLNTGGATICTGWSGTGSAILTEHR